MAVKKTKAGKREGAERELRITLVRSLIGGSPSQREAAKGLGLRKINSVVVRQDSPEIRGLMTKISHLVKAEVLKK